MLNLPSSAVLRRRKRLVTIETDSPRLDMRRMASSSCAVAVFHLTSRNRSEMVSSDLSLTINRSSKVNVQPFPIHCFTCAHPQLCVPPLPLPILL